MANRLFRVLGLAALTAMHAHSQSVSDLAGAVAITTTLQFVTEDDVEQRTKLNLLLAQKRVDREGVIGELATDVDRIAKAERAGLLSDTLRRQGLHEPVARA